ncbi:MAG: hypothetical protein JXA89_08040 [Anaerolineae bacterium]|nr:hypothetical protein [Anaerolineae bacterium]
MRKLGRRFFAFCVMATFFLGIESGIHPISVVGNDPNLQNTRTADGFTVYLPLVTNWHDPAYVLPFGVTVYSDVGEPQGLPEMQAAGSKWITTRFNWSEVEPVKGYYDWSSFDAKAQNAQTLGMDIFALFTDNPGWAAQYPGGPVYNMQNLVTIATLMAERYDCDGVDDAPGSPCVHYWSFYAEPDNGDSYRASRGKGYWGHDGSGYAAMLAQVAPAIRQADPNGKIMIGGLAYDWFEDEGGPFVRSFLADTLQALNTYPGGAKTYLDAVAFHFYPVSAQRWPTIRDKALGVKQVMNQYGAGDLPLTCPEMGYWSDVEFGSNETIQANRLAQMYVRGASARLVHMAWYKIFDKPLTDQYRDLFGLFKEGDLNSPKKSYRAYRTAARELAYAYYRRPLGIANVEGYVFGVAGNREKTILWATTASAFVSFPGSCSRVVQTLGSEQEIRDGQTGDIDGIANGQVQIQVIQDKPVYVGVCD